MSNLYKKSGVNIKKGSEVVRTIKSHVASTHGEEVLQNIGSFGGLFNLTKIIKKYKNPVLVQSIDGVGTKLTIAKMMNKYDTVGEDIVNHSCNDILAMGARPLTFLDYVANETLVPKEMESILKGMAKACRENGVALIGGETAEMPGIYQKSEHDIAGCITGIVEKNKIITGKNIKEGDAILGFPSSGLHTNGFSLAREILFKKRKYTVRTKGLFDKITGQKSKEILGETLLKVHSNYCKPVFSLLDKKIEIKGIAHITGGGFIENIPRILPKNTDAEITKGSWPMLPIFPFLQKIGKIGEKEMYKVFNMSIGLVIVVKENQKEKIEKLLENHDIFWIGKIIKGTGKVQFKKNK